METLRVLWLNWRDIFNPTAGGAELYTHQVLRRLASKGHEITLFASRYPGSAAREVNDEYDIVRNGNNFSVYLEAARFFRTQRKLGLGYDIIVDAMNTIPFGSPLYASSSLVIALIYQLTGDIFLKQFRPPIGHILRELEKRSYVPWWLNRVNHVVTLSDSSKRELMRLSIELREDEVTTIPPGVDHDNFEPATKADQPIVLFMNRLVRYKQPEDVIRMMKAISRHVADAKLFVIGTPANVKYATSLHRLVSSLGLEQTVSFQLFKPFSSRKIKLLQQAWIHFLPSIKEGFGLSILESAACGTPTVGYNVSGVRDAVVHGRTGYLAQLGDVTSLANHAVDLLTDEERRSSFGSNAVNWAKRFRWDDAAQGFLTVFQKAVIQ